MEKTLKLRYVLLPFCLSVLLSAADPPFPQAEISNGLIKAKLLLPDPEHGYYRGTRFDWDGVMESLTFDGHNFFGKWFDRYEPTLHDAIMGPVEEFRTGETAIGYDEAKPGGLFIKIGVGILRKPDDQKYSQFRTYPLVSPGKRIVTPESDRVIFQHELSNGEGYAYVYKKTVRLARGKPELIIEHSLKNVGSKVIDTSVYNHDFYMIDNQPAGPSYRVAFAFAPQAKNDLKGLAEIRGKELVYQRDLHAGGESVYTPISGFGTTPVDNDIVVENAVAKAGVREMGDRPLSNFYFWSIRSTVCPEGYIHMSVAPGNTFKWKITYRFYTLPLAEAKKKRFLRSEGKK
jgi:hypothetical protein